MKIASHVALALLMTIGMPFALGASGSDLQREKNWADQIMDNLIAGEAVWLRANKVKFLGLYTAPAPNGATAKRGVILAHGRGVHPAWGFIDNLRIDLADADWHTLSLQMPILDPQAAFREYGKTFPEAFQRIDAGIDFLKQRGVETIFLLGHSTGALMCLGYAAERPAAPVAGIVAIGTSSDAGGGPYMQPAQMLAKIRKPVLDIYGSADLPVVLTTAAARREAARRAKNGGYSQVRVHGAEHFFIDRYDRLAAAVRGWLDKAGGK